MLSKPADEGQNYWLSSGIKDAYYASKAYATLDSGTHNNDGWKEMVEMFERSAIIFQETKEAMRQLDYTKIEDLKRELHNVVQNIQGLLTLRDNTLDIPLDYREEERLKNLSILLQTMLSEKIWPGEQESKGWWSYVQETIYGTKLTVKALMELIDLKKPENIYVAPRTMQRKSRSKDRDILEEKWREVEDARNPGKKSPIRTIIKSTAAGILLLLTHDVFTSSFEEVMGKVQIEQNIKDDHKVHVVIPSGYERSSAIFWTGEESNKKETHEKVGTLDEAGSFQIREGIHGDVNVSVYIEYGGHRVETKKLIRVQ